MFDVLFSDVTVVLPAEATPILKHQYVGVAAGKITYLSDIKPSEEAKETILCEHKVMMPGMVNAHTHIPMTPFRGWGDGCDLHTWLNTYIFPYEAKMNSKAAAICANLGLAEAIASGTTTIEDMYFFYDTVAGAVAQSGINANLSRGMNAFDSSVSFEDMQGFLETKELVAAWHGYDNGRIKVDASIHAEYTSGPWLWEPLAAYAKEHGLGIHVHVSETKSEHEGCIGRYGKTPTAVLADAGVFDSRVVAAHGVWLSSEDIALMAAHGASVVHNPISNLKLGSGMADVPQMRELGLNVALGTDGVSSNDSLDMFEELKIASILHRGVTLNPTVLGTKEALQMATCNGAKALGRTDTGTLAVGQYADLVLLDFDKPHLTPRHDEMALITYAARGSDVCLTMVRGKILYKDGVCLTIDVEKAKAELASYVMPLVF